MSNSVETFESSVCDTDALQRLLKLAAQFETYRDSLQNRIGSFLPIAHPLEESAMFELVGRNALYDLRRATAVGDLRILDLGNHEVGYEIQDTDAFALFTRDSIGAEWNRWCTVIVDYDGAISYAREFYKGPLAHDGVVTEGVTTKAISAAMAADVINDMYRFATPIEDTDMCASSHWLYRQFALEMWGHSIAIDR